MRRSRIPSAIAFAVLLTLSAARTSAAADVKIVAATVGVGDTWKYGYWTELQLELTSEAGFQGRAEVVAPDGEGASVQYRSDEELNMPPGGALTLRRLIKLGRPVEHLAVRFTTSDDSWLARIELPPGLPSQQDVLLQLGGAGGLDRRKLKGFEVRDLVASHLPENWIGLSAFDFLWISGGDEQASQLNERQLAALRLWLEQGGHLVICLGQQAESLLSPGGPWSPLLPAEYRGTGTRQFGGGIEQFAGAQVRLPPFTAANFEPTVSNARVLASVTAANQQFPVILRAPVGFGVVTLAGLDLEAAPLADWEATPTLARLLLEVEGKRLTVEEQTVGSIRHVGFDDLSGQIRSALDSFSDNGELAATANESESTGAGAGGSMNVGLISFALVILILVVYAVLLGPGDYYLLAQLRKPVATWVTFPLLVAALCGAIAWLRGELKSNRPLANQVDVVDVCTVTGSVRGTLWAQLYSPSTAKWEVQSRPVPALAGGGANAEMLLSWQGLPGSYLGGMSSSSQAGLLTEPYQLDRAASRLLQLPMRTASTRSLAGRWWARNAVDEPARPTQGSLATPDAREFAYSKLTDRDGVLRGRLTSPLTVDLRDCVLFYNNWAHLFNSGEIAAGETVLAEDLLRRDLDWRLTRRRIASAADTSYTSTPWDEESRDVSRIMEMLMFHNAAGGERYTRLKHAYQGYLDLTTHLKLGRAVLVGRASTPATRLTADGAVLPGQQWCYYRVIFPVAPER